MNINHSEWLYNRIYGKIKMNNYFDFYWILKVIDFIRNKKDNDFIRNKRDNKLVMRQKDIRCTECNKILYVTPFDIICANCKTIKSDTLEIMIQKQRKLQEILKTDIHTQHFINLSAYALISEVTEALNETPWKPWKKQQNFNKSNFKNELIDCFHFLINLCISVDMTATEILNLFLIKHKINLERHKNDY